MTSDQIVLSDAQRQAVDWPDGSVLVLAGPGAGKTEVLAGRAARLIHTSGKRRYRILGLTFTNLAASEMQQRVALRLGYESERVRLGTFHSFCARVLRQHGSHLGLRPDFRILTLDAERAVVLADALTSRAPWGNQPPPVRRIARNLDQLFRTDPAPVGGSDSADRMESGWGRWILEPYVTRLIEKNCMDYGSLLYCCFRLVRERPRIAEDFPIAYPHVLVDEYQDTNAIQDRLLRQLWPPGSSDLFVVGDDDQTIYQWNGANPERIAALATDYRMTVLQLPESHRCPERVLHCANRLMTARSAGASQRAPLVAAGSEKGTGSVESHSFPTETAEMAWVAQDIRRRGRASGQCAVLGRSGRLVEAAFSALHEARVPSWRRQPLDQFISPEVRFVLAALRLANAPSNGAQLRLLSKAFRELVGISVQPSDVEVRADLEDGALLIAFAASARESADSTPAKALVRVLQNHLVDHRNHRRFASAAFQALRKRQEGPDHPEGSTAETEIAVWESLSAQIRRQSGSEPTLEQFLHELDLRPIVPEPKLDEVRCLTIHQAKGEEFRHVYLIGLTDDELPSYHAKKAGPGSPQMAEERRNCFVAITRASETLTLTHARSYFGWPKERSRFLVDMGVRFTV